MLLNTYLSIITLNVNGLKNVKIKIYRVTERIKKMRSIYKVPMMRFILCVYLLIYLYLGGYFIFYWIDVHFTISET